MSIRGSIALAGLAAALAWPALGQALSPDRLVAALQQGGYVVVMRHAHAPAEPPSPAEADPANAGRERQLDVVGRNAASAFGAALKTLKVPVGAVLTSPAYRARQTASLAGLPKPGAFDALGDGGASMQAVGAPFATFLKAQAAAAPKPGTDTFVVTHQPNLTAAFDGAAAGLEDGEALVFKPHGQAEPKAVGRLKISDWTAAAQAR